jgi:chitinase
MIFLLYSIIAAYIPFATGAGIPPRINSRNVHPMLADNTCRWTNCGENCSPGFVSIPRAGGARDEMMWDNTYCNGRGVSRFCCPANAPQPSCTWRGHANSGKCTPGCRNGESEVWTLKAGCKSGHQSACCKTDTTSMEAYASCQWEGKAPRCWGDMVYPPLDPCRTTTFDHVAIQAIAGFGGADACSHGMFCCML